MREKLDNWLFISTLENDLSFARFLTPYHEHTPISFIYKTVVCEVVYQDHRKKWWNVLALKETLISRASFCCVDFSKSCIYESASHFQESH